MITHLIEATNIEGGGMNWGKFMLGRFDKQEWEHRSVVDERGLIQGRGWMPYHIFVLDLQTGEGAIFRPGGLAKCDLDKHRIWCCPLYEPFLQWLYQQDLTDITKLHTLVHLNDAESAFYGYRRQGQEEEQEEIIGQSRIPEGGDRPGIHQQEPRTTRPGPRMGCDVDPDAEQRSVHAA